MLHNSATITRSKFENYTGWTFKPEGACKGDVCIPLRTNPANSSDIAEESNRELDLAELADQMGMPLVSAPEHNLWALGPEAVGAHALTTAAAPALTLPDLAGQPFDLASLHGKKIVVYAWAPY